MSPIHHIETPTIEWDNTFYYDAIPIVDNSPTQPFKYVAINFSKAGRRKQNSTIRKLKLPHQLKWKHILNKFEPNN
jgi:hypothetical protein